MLTNPLQRYSPYHKNTSAMSSTSGNGTQPQMQVNGLNGLGQNPSHSGQHLPQQANTTGIPLPRAPTRARQHANGSRGSGSSGAIRRRISRACDQCNQLRTKCDGQNPCAHCVEFGLGCEYMRERKKRGKVSKKDLAQQAAAQTAAGSTTAQGSTESDDADGQRGQIQVSEGFRVHESTQHSNANATNAHEMHGNASNGGGRSMIQQDGAGEKLDGIPEAVEEPQLGGQHGNVGDLQDSTTGLDLNGYGAVSPGYDRTNPGGSVLGDQLYNQAVQGQMGHFPDFSYTMQGHGSPDFAPSGPFRMANNLGFTMAGGPSPGWGMSVPSPTGQIQQHFTHPTVNHSNLRYPVIEPLLPHLNNVIPVALACDLVNLYFASSSSALMHPMSPYVLGFLFRKRSFLHPTKPRYCQPALLASMLWVAAQTSDAPLLTSSPSARAKTCQKLLELTISLLRPLIHSTGDVTAGSSPSADGVALGGLGVAMPGTISMDALTGEFGPFGSAGSLDDVITYIHLATVVSASEYKGASIRWWNAAWSLARELKLGRELPSGPPPMAGDLSNLENETEDVHDIHRNISGYVTEEEREERRRIWWLIYGVDRHLALCYNRPLFLLDVECYGLLQPMDEMKWQAGDFSPFTSEEDGPSEGGMVHGGPQTMRIRGPCFECRGHSIFGYFIPLMTILGEIVDLHHARNHPRFGIGFRSASVWDQQGAEITRHLEIYENSLNEFEQKHLPGAAGATSDQGPDTPSANSILTNGSNRMSEGDIQTRIVIAYGTHVMNVLHILLAGKWDPINLLDDNDLWISSDEFITATSRAVAAAEAIGQILEYDPGLEFMPFFFGIYLLQGSFLLLLIADKLQSEASPSVAKACETIVRAHEACVVTLSTEYQRNFSKVMRSALAQVRGRVPEDLGERHQRRRELLSLYRWTGDGTGLAL